ncbi:MAG: type I-B CRISPR-associated protein Cas7/Csh2 [Veillonellaceae bacterium]|nr:type I-B CRISPR-associated protein Cas7/Csh2 [Veillonellaceae bacterium]
MENVIKKRSEILFVYDVTDANPNGDPIDENKPRIDEETGINIVTDVRLKRTVRDYLYDFKQQGIFVRGIPDESDSTKLKTKEDQFSEFGSPDEIIKKCIDIRLFGGTFALKSEKKKSKKSEEEIQETDEGKAFSITGPVQFKFGRSLHKVDLTYIKGTTVMPSGKGKEQGTFTEKYILPYSLIAFYGIINENAAQNQNIPLTEADINLLMDGIWNGTKNLISASKVGQMPRFLLRVVYKEENFHIGELDKRIKFTFTKNDKELRAITDGKLDITELVSVFNKNKDKIEKIYYKTDEYVCFISDNNEIKIEEALKDFSPEIISF